MDMDWCVICRKDIPMEKLEDHEEWHREGWMDSLIDRERKEDHADRG